ncbi:hypothetical protein G6011_00074 [Alternaria panax]|uniref:Uncharacterized protein n=1 Tax=Alternaria panax TaxID=48097 RepID=A0AAD4II55_9PLEO|nr:hypothetical protein G6011_00074 [Alternaria panax]
MLYPSALLRWFQRKRYQYEVTFSLYMLTSTEKFIFNSVLFLLLSLLIIAASLYLPEHLTIIANRMSYYLSGNRDALASATPKDVGMPNAPLGAGAMGNGRGMMEL